MQKAQMEAIKNRMHHKMNSCKEVVKRGCKRAEE
jgi:hypothetical protein